MKLPKPRFSTGRVVLFVLLFMIQIIWFLAFVTQMVEHSWVIDLALQVLSVAMILYLIRKDESPAYRNSWMVLIAIIPIFGGLFYVLVGNKRTTKKMAQQLQSQMDAHQQDMKGTTDATHELAKNNPRLATLSHYITTQSNTPVQSHSAVTYYSCGEEAFQPILEAMESATRYIFVEFFIIKSGKMADAFFEVMARKAQQGVDVRLIFDDYGTMMTLPRDFQEQMASRGIRCLKFNPFTPIVSLAINTRDHRKMIVVDGRVGFTGGMNLADEYINAETRFGYWKDNFVRIEGLAVWHFVTMFLNMWNAFKHDDDDYSLFQPTWDEALPPSAGFVQVFGDSPLDSEPLGENVYRDILNQASDYVYIYTPYLVISYELQTALTLAAKRGVDVRLMTPGIPDKKMVYRMTRSYYRPLLQAGVKIYEYTPGFLHAKTFVSDDVVASVGSINLDYRSLYLHFELNALLYYHEAILDVKDDFLASQAVSREVTFADCRSSLVGQIWDSILRLTAPFV